MNIQERTLVAGQEVAFTVPLNASRILISSNSTAGFFITLFEGDGQGRRFFVNPSMQVLDLRAWSADATQFFITANAGTVPDTEFVSVWVI